MEPIVVNSEYEEYDISHLRYGDSHPWLKGKIFWTWLKDVNGRRTPVWRKASAYKPRKWMNSKVYTDHVILRRFIVQPESNKGEEVAHIPKGATVIEDRPKQYIDAKIALGRYLLAKRGTCRKKGIPFSLTLDNLPPTPEFCPILGIPMIRNAGTIDDYCPSLDRIIPSKGYIPENIIWISVRANRIKTSATWQEIKKVAEFYEKLCPDMSEVHVPTPEAAYEIRSLILPPKQPIARAKKEPRPRPCRRKQNSLQDVYAQIWASQEKEWEVLESLDNSLFWSNIAHYRVIYKKQHGYAAKRERLETAIRWALPQWKMKYMGRGEFSLYPVELQKELSEFDPEIAKAELCLFGQSVAGHLKADKCFIRYCEKNRHNAYRLIV